MNPIHPSPYCEVLFYNVTALLEVRHPRCVGSKRILCIARTVENNYILPSSTVGIQLHVSALYVDHLQVVI